MSPWLGVRPAGTPVMWPPRHVPLSATALNPEVTFGFGKSTASFVNIEYPNEHLELLFGETAIRDSQVQRRALTDGSLERRIPGRVRDMPALA